MPAENLFPCLTPFSQHCEGMDRMWHWRRFFHMIAYLTSQ